MEIWNAACCQAILKNVNNSALQGIKPWKYEILSLCLLKSSESANISHPGIQPASTNRIHDTNELVHVKHLQLHNKYSLFGKLYIA